MAPEQNSKEAETGVQVPGADHLRYGLLQIGVSTVLRINATLLSQKGAIVGGQVPF